MLGKVTAIEKESANLGVLGAIYLPHSKHLSIISRDIRNNNLVQFRSIENDTNIQKYQEEKKKEVVE